MYLADVSSSPWELFGYYANHTGQVTGWLWSHAWLSLLPVVIGLVLALPLGWLANRYRWVYPPMVSVAGLLYTIPSIALFVVMPSLLGTQVLDPLNVVVALAVYTLALMVRVVADGLAAVPADVAQAATAMGYTRLQRVIRVELPIAVPVIAAGLRVAAVANVSMVAIAGTIGVANLGQLFTNGFQLSSPDPYYPPIALGIVLCVLLALAFDAIIVLGNRAATPVATGGGRTMISFSSTWTWLNDPLNWRANATGPGIPAQLLSHLLYSVLAIVIAAAIAIPLGLAVGHGRRGSWLVSAANSLRALPTTGLLILLYVIVAPHITGRGVAVYLIPTEIVLVLLAVPPLLANTYAGIQNVEPSVRDAARGMGMTGSQVLWRVEVPNALPLMFSGLRGAALQVIATATVAAYVGLDGLGRYVYDGLSQRDFPQMVGGGLLVAILALLVDLVLATVQRYAVSRGVSGRRSRTVRRPAPDARTAAIEEVEAVPA